MGTLVNQPTAVAHWHTLVTEAAVAAACPLEEDLESYLVFLLMRFTSQPGLAGKVLALDYLHGMLASGRVKQEALRDVGDHCLLYSGLFPQQAERRRVRVSYFVDMGRSAYRQVSQRAANSYADLYAHLSHDFVALMDVLHAIRRQSLSSPCLMPLPAYELWSDTGSRQAYRALQEVTHGFPIIGAEQETTH